MRVLIDTTYAQRARFSGTGVYIERLCRALSASGEVDVVAACNPWRRPPGGGGAGSLRNALADEWWLAVELPRRARAAGADLIHHPLPARSYGCSLPQVVTVHDLAFERFPGHFAAGFRRYAHLAHRAAARRASAVVAVSQTTAADMGELWGVTGERVIVAPHGPGQELRAGAQGPGSEAGTPAGAGAHFLYVGDEEPRKDLATLMAAHELYVARGGRVPLVRPEPGCSPNRLGELFAAAVALVHPARYEGFGLTVLEAMATGVPVIAAACPAVVELTAGTARLFAPGDVEELARALAGALDRGEAAVERARARAQEFSWARSARSHLDAYSWALGR